MTKDRNNSSCTPTIVIVGAGPVGLWAAIQIKKRRPDCRIIIYERHAEYMRSHVLRLDHLSMLLYCKRSRSERERQFFEELIGDDNRLTPSKSVYIRTQKLEAALRRYAIDLGVAICQRTIDTPSELEQLHPEAICFIAADGAHSRMRKGLLGESDTITKRLQNVVEIKYEACGTPRQLDFVNERYKTQKILTFLTFEYIGQQRDGRAPVTLRMFVDDVTFGALPDATFKSPLLLNKEKLPENLARDISTYLNVRKELSGEEYVANSGRLTKLVLSTYRARKFCIRRAERTWFFVGDAAMGIPYFRALNCGLLCASLLARICSRIDKHPRSTGIARFAYTWFATMRFLTELFIARTKNIILQWFDGYRRMGAKVPWQTHRWSNEITFIYRSHEHYAFFEDDPA